MATRHEEKYIIDYRQYAVMKNRAMALMTPDSHGINGCYTINSLYYDDLKDTALLEKLDGLPEHRKFRVRTYDYSDRVINLERKDKRGILTEKFSASLPADQIGLLDLGTLQPEDAEAGWYDLAAQMHRAGLRPAVVVRYERDAFFLEGTDLRLTFDKNLEAIVPDDRALFDPHMGGLPAISRGSVIMEIKYGDRVPSLIRTMTNFSSKQLSVSKYALCRSLLATGRRSL